MRIQLNSRDNQVHVFKKYSTIEENKTYILKVEQLQLPPKKSAILFENELFRLERRLKKGFLHSYIDNTVDEIEEPPPLPCIFIPQHCNSPLELLYQMNTFFRNSLLKILATKDLQDDADFNNLHADYAVQDETDWFDIKSTEGGEKIKFSITASYRPDGRVGFRFSEAASGQFVIKLTAAGKQLFGKISGVSKDYIAADVNGDFSKKYLVQDPVGEEGDFLVAIDPPTGANLCVMDNNVLNDSNFRHEIVLHTSIPLQNYVEIVEKRAVFKNQLASYTYPKKSVSSYYDKMFKRWDEFSSNVYIFENSKPSWNYFKLTGSLLQNFHIDLYERKYIWNSKSYELEMTEIPYSLLDDEFWSITLEITPLK